MQILGQVTKSFDFSRARMLQPSPTVQQKQESNSTPLASRLGSFTKKTSAIMKEHNLNNISSNGLRSLCHELRDSGIITSEQLLDLTAPYVVRRDAQMRDISNPDEKRDFINDLAQSIEAVQRANPGDMASIAYLQRVKNLAESLNAAAN